MQHVTLQFFCTVKQCVTFPLAAEWRQKDFQRSCWAVLLPMADWQCRKPIRNSMPAELEKLRGLGYQELAFEILSRFADDIPEDDLRDIIGRTYTVEKFQSEEITPLKTLEPGVAYSGVVEWSDTGIQGYCHAIAGEPV